MYVCIVCMVKYNIFKQITSTETPLKKLNTFEIFYISILTCMGESISQSGCRKYSLISINIYICTYVY